MNFRARLRSQSPGFQMAPMIDIVFLLLTFFVASQIYAQWETAIGITLPTARTAELPRRLPGEVILNLQADGTVIVNEQVLEETQLAAMLRRLVEHFPGQPVVLRGDRAVPFEEVIRVLDLCREADLWNISFATAMPGADGGPEAP